MCRTGLGLIIAVSLVLGGCKKEDEGRKGGNAGQPRDEGDGHGRDEDEVGGGREGDTTTEYTCYDAGYADCYYYYEPDADWWGCSSNAEYNDYWDGYCACEFDFYDTYYCGYYSTTYYSTTYY